MSRWHWPWGASELISITGDGSLTGGGLPGENALALLCIIQAVEHRLILLLFFWHQGKIITLKAGKWKKTFRKCVVSVMLRNYWLLFLRYVFWGELCKVNAHSSFNCVQICLNPWFIVSIFYNCCWVIVFEICQTSCLCVKWQRLKNSWIICSTRVLNCSHWMKPGFVRPDSGAISHRAENLTLN